MRQAHLRTLAARGISVQGALKISGLDAYQATGEAGQATLVFSGAAAGPSWVSIGQILESSDVGFSLVTLSRPYFVVDDSSEVRQLLEGILPVSRQSVREEVFVEGQGFLVSVLPKKFDARLLIAPISVLVGTMAFAFWILGKPAQSPDSAVIPLACAIDMTQAEFASWLQEQILTTDESVADQLVIRTELGIIDLTIEQTLGSTQLMSGAFSCEDGRSTTLQFRTDSEQAGSFVDLGQGLDP
jgi:hypothetical protein